MFCSGSIKDPGIADIIPNIANSCSEDLKKLKKKNVIFATPKLNGLLKESISE
jgi:hypothetical protein